MEYVTFNSDLLLPPNGINNFNGVSCYLNSLLQALLSCTSLIEILIKQPENSTVGKIFLTHVQKILFPHQSGSYSPSNFSLAISNHINRYVLINNRIQFGRGQECADECFTHFIESLNCKRAEQLFFHRYRLTITCTACNSKVSSVNDHQIQMYIHDIPPEARTEESFIKHLMNYKTPVMNYKCEKCGFLHQKIMRHHQLVMVPEILVLTFKKYYNKTDIWFPAKLSIPTNDMKFFKYKIVSTISHFGNQFSGHYTARSVRRSANKSRIYEFNDQSVTKSTFDFNDRSSVYIVFYHMMP